MYKKPDEDGRYPLSAKEYDAIRAIFGAVYALTEMHPVLEQRCKTIKGGWRDIRLLVTVADRLMDALLLTVPRKKLRAMKRELENTVMEIKMKPAVLPNTDDYLTVVPQGAVEYVTQKALDFCCLGCEKRDYRNCELFNSVQSLYHYDFPKAKECPLNDMFQIKGCDRDEL